jgi:hypothetical protein
VSMPTNLLVWLVVVLGGMVLAILILGIFKKFTVEHFGDFGQGLAGIAAAGAILVGGALFIAEGRAQPRLLLRLTATVVPAEPAGGRQEQVYVQIVTTIENQGLLSPATIQCAAFDASAIAPNGRRDTAHANDLSLHSLLTAAADHGRDWGRCLQMEARLAAAGAFIRPTSGFRWADFQIQPGQTKTRNYELLVPCSLSGIRVIVKIPDPAGGVLERKMAISIVDVCGGRTDRAVATVADEGPPSTTPSDAAVQAPAPQPAAADTGNGT